MQILWNWMDILLLAILVLFGVWGWRGGLVKKGFQLLSLLASVLFARMFYPALAEQLRHTGLYQSLFLSVEEKAVPAQQATLLPQGLLETLEQGSLTAVHAATEYFASLILNVLSFAILLVLARVLLWGLQKILHLVVSLPIISFLNRLGGLAFGALEGFLVVCIVLSVFAAVPALRENARLHTTMEQSVITQAIQKHNPILRMLLPKTEAE